MFAFKRPGAGRSSHCDTIARRIRRANDELAASTHLSATRHGEADGERSFRFGSRIRRLLAAYRHPAGHKAEAIKTVDGGHRRADRAQWGPRICIPPRYSGLVRCARFALGQRRVERICTSCSYSLARCRSPLCSSAMGLLRGVSSVVAVLALDPTTLGIGAGPATTSISPADTVTTQKIRSTQALLDPAFGKRKVIARKSAARSLNVNVTEDF
jgi:hypothetical protein